jgi:hypothetical protein
MACLPKPGLEPTLLEAITYPTNQTALLKRAKEMHAPDSVVDAILRLPHGPFDSREELVAAVEQISAS